MTDDSASKGTHESKLSRVLAEYLEAVEQGFDVSQDQWIARHPDCADQLREFFSGRQLLADVVSPAVNAGTSAVNAPTMLPGEPSAKLRSAEPFRVRYFGEYELLEEIARGGMGVVFKARQVTLKRIVALKMILSGQFAGDEDVKRFHAEAQAAARLDHPNIVPIFEIGQHEGQHYFSMAFVKGESLARRVAEGPLPPREAARLMKLVADAVAYAHVEGVVHRDLKPANVLLDQDGEPRVTDFGLAKRTSTESVAAQGVGSTTELTKTGQVLGTPSYMPPEQACGKTDEIGPLSDVYSLGAMLYCLLAGRPPFQAASPLDTLLQVLHKEPVPVRQLDPNVPRDLETICLKCLEKEPRRRYASARALSDDLNRFLNGEPVKARPISRPARAWRWCRRNRVVAGLTAIVAVLLAAVGIVASAGYFTVTRALEQSRRHLYVAHLNLAQQALDDGEDGRALGLLERHVPVYGEGNDLRGWEWNYLRARCRIALHLGAGSVHSVAWSPDGRSLASGTPGIVQIWSVAEGLEAGTLLERKSVKDPSVLARNWLLRVDPDGAPVGRTDDGRMVELRGHEFPSVISSVAWSPDGTQLASGSWDKTVRIWDVATGRELLTLRGHSDKVLAVAWSSDGTRLASCAYDQTLRVWDTSTGDQLLVLKGHSELSESVIGFAMEIVWRDQDRQLVAAYSDRTTFWDVTAGKVIHTLEHIQAVAWSPDRERFADTWGIVEASTGTQLLNLRDSWGSASQLAWSPDGRWLLEHNGGPKFRIRDAATGDDVLSMQGGGHTFCWSPDSRYVAAAGDGIQIWDTAPEVRQLKLTGTADRKAYWIAWSPDGRLLAVAEWFGFGAAVPCDVQVWDTVTGKLLRSLSGHAGELGCVAWSLDGAHLASIEGSGVIKIWETQNWEEVATLTGLGPVGSEAGHWSRLEWSPDSRFLAGSSGPDTLKVWHNGTWQEALSSHAPEDGSGVRHLIGWTPEGRLLFEGTNPGWNSGLLAWDPEQGTEPELLKRYGAWSGSWFLSPDGTWTVELVGTDITIFGASSWKSRPTLSGHTSWVHHVAWSPDGNRLASVAGDGMVKLWDVESGQELLTLPGGELSVAFSPDGRRLAAGQGNTVTIWDAEPR